MIHLRPFRLLGHGPRYRSAYGLPVEGPDPDEQAALDEIRRRRQRQLAASQPPASRAAPDLNS